MRLQVTERLASHASNLLTFTNVDLVIGKNNLHIACETVVCKTGSPQISKSQWVLLKFRIPLTRVQKKSNYVEAAWIGILRTGSPNFLMKAAFLNIRAQMTSRGAPVGVPLLEIPYHDKAYEAFLELLYEKKKKKTESK